MDKFLYYELDFSIIGKFLDTSAIVMSVTRIEWNLFALTCKIHKRQGKRKEKTDKVLCTYTCFDVWLGVHDKKFQPLHLFTSTDITGDWCRYALMENWIKNICQEFHLTSKSCWIACFWQFWELTENIN